MAKQQSRRQALMFLRQINSARRGLAYAYRLLVEEQSLDGRT